ncbi:MAG TPA: cobyrinate a,c-diamide synthase, partial [Nitrososphaera sp.]|nr:cobyrinate a,c-diamide synthase [Nitrososphaera sp.]
MSNSVLQLAASIVIAGVSSGVGKTTIASAIMYSLRRKGLAVQPFKVGPDFIDPSYHEIVSRRHSRNLDPWLMGTKGVLDCFDRNSEDADIAVVEGVMGLYDGFSGSREFASTAQVAKMLGAPVILVIDASKMARSAAAIALGFMHFDSAVNIAGFIINNVGSERHARYIRDAFESKIRKPILGIISRRKGEDTLAQRHLGLVPAAEMEAAQKSKVLKIVRLVSEQLDIDSLLQISRTSTPAVRKPGHRLGKQKKVKASIAVALDESFNFYYRDNLEILRRAGADLLFFSPLSDRRVPNKADGLMIGGGFPEVLADNLEKNREMLASIAGKVSEGMPLYAECGGLMYLTKSISGYKGSAR